jgi:ubiquinone/menaquinone biosynthesis C-methylase UbiE
MNKLFVLAALLAAPAFPQAAANANKGYQTHEARENVARNLSDPQREQQQNPRALIEAMNLQAGWTVADVGTGVGFLLPYLSHAVGPTGHVIAEDIHTDFLDQAKLKARAAGLANVQFILGTERDPKLPGDTANAALALEVYHHFDYPEPMLASIRDSLVSDGRLYIADYYRRAGAMPGGNALEHIRLDRDDVIKEVEASGFKLVSNTDHIPGKMYLLAFEKRR